MNELALYLLDIVQNSFRANAKNVVIELLEKQDDNLLEIGIKDDGNGINEGKIKELTNPFYTTRKTRKVGLGIPFLSEQCELSGGRLEIISDGRTYTYLKATMQLDHMNRLPFGNLEESLFSLMINPYDVNIDYQHRRGDKVLQIRSIDIKKVLDGIPFDNPEVLFWLQQYIQNNYKDFYEVEV